MKVFRLNRLFHPGSRRCVGVAFDAGSTADEAGLDQAVRTLVDAGVDALELTIGQADTLQRLPGKQKPALILRTDVTNLRHVESGPLFSRIIGNAAEQAVRLDAAAVIVSLLVVPGHPELTAQCLENIHKLQPECERWCLPLIIEPRVFRESKRADGFVIDGSLDQILPLIRQAVELGADLIQADPTDDLSVYQQVIESADRIPVLVRSGGKTAAEILAHTETLIQQGVAGIIYGREVLQHQSTADLTRTLLAIVHDEGTATEAIQSTR